MSMISVKQALVYGINELRKAKINSARLDAEILISFLLGCTMEKLISNIQCPISNAQFNKYKRLIKKRAQHYPIAYLTHFKEFYGIDFFVNKNVLIPRPETEILVESVLHFVGNRHACSLLELGTGSGCIALTLAKYLPKAKIIATDISNKALSVARKNRSLIQTRSRVSLQNIKFKKSNLLSNIKSKSDIIVANLPYLTLKELKEKSISKEPKSALYGGKDGLELYKKLFKQIKEKFNIQYSIFNIVIFLEIGETQGKKIKKLVKKYFPNTKIEIKKDLAGRDRVAIINF